MAKWDGAVFKDKVWQGEKTNNPKGFDNPALKGDEIMSKNIIDVIRGIIITKHRNVHILSDLAPDSIVKKVVMDLKNDKTSLYSKRFRTLEVRSTVYSGKTDQSYRYQGPEYNPAQLAIIFKREDWLDVVYEDMTEEEFARDFLNLPTNPQQPP